MILNENEFAHEETDNSTISIQDAVGEPTANIRTNNNNNEVFPTEILVTPGAQGVVPAINKNQGVLPEINVNQGAQESLLEIKEASTDEEESTNEQEECEAETNEDNEDATNKAITHEQNINEHDSDEEEPSEEHTTTTSEQVKVEDVTEDKPTNIGHTHTQHEKIVKNPHAST